MKEIAILLIGVAMVSAASLGSLENSANRDTQLESQDKEAALKTDLKEQQENSKDPCSSNPCQDGELCVLVLYLPGIFYCTPCPSGFGGTNCELRAREATEITARDVELEQKNADRDMGAELETQEKETAMKTILKELLEKEIEEMQAREIAARDMELAQLAELKEIQAGEQGDMEIELEEQRELEAEELEDELNERENDDLEMERELEVQEAMEDRDMKLEMQTQDKRDGLKTILKSLLENALEEQETRDMVARNRELDMLAQGDMEGRELAERIADSNMELENEMEEREFAERVAEKDMELEMLAKENEAEEEAQAKREELKFILKSLLENKEDLEMEAKDSESRCKSDTKNCDGHGTCMQSTFGRRYGQFVCSCDQGYTTNYYGGCSPKTSTRELDILKALAAIMEE